MSAAARVRDWLEERVGWRDMADYMKAKTVPAHRYSYWYYFGGVTLFLFGVQVVTGVLLLLYYRPSSNEAFESVQYIVTQVEFGWLIRSVHSWAANLMVLTAFAHMFSVVFLGAYRRPREITWISGMLLLALVLAFGFSGYLLPWNELAFFATKVGTEMVAKLPLIGHQLMVFMRGGEDVTGATLTRFYALHVAVLPAITTVLIAFHLLLVQRHGMSVPRSVEKEWQRQPSARRETRFFPNFFLRELIAWYLALAALGALAALAPWELGVKADPFVPAPAGIKPEWYFLFMFETLKLLPPDLWIADGEVAGILWFGVGGVVWMLLPFFDPHGEGRRRRWVLGAGLFILAYMTALTIYGHFK
jgi:quinol-cytochrome oxidoreductase complex cytochrome b subunit